MSVVDVVGTQGLQSGVCEQRRWGLLFGGGQLSLRRRDGRRRDERDVEWAESKKGG